jgi:hypothetical protein
MFDSSDIAPANRSLLIKRADGNLADGDLVLFRVAIIMPAIIASAGWLAWIVRGRPDGNTVSGHIGCGISAVGNSVYCLLVFGTTRPRRYAGMTTAQTTQPPRKPPARYPSIRTSQGAHPGTRS